MTTTQELFEEWKDLWIKGISYQRAGADGYMSEKAMAEDDRIFNRKKEIEAILRSMGYEIVDGEAPYSRGLKKI